MVATVVMDTMASLVATAMVTGIVVTVVQDVTIVIGDEIEGQGEASHLLRPSPCSGDMPNPITPTYLFPRPSKFPSGSRPARRGFARQAKSLVGNAYIPTVLALFDPRVNK